MGQVTGGKFRSKASAISNVTNERIGLALKLGHYPTIAPNGKARPPPTIGHVSPVSHDARYAHLSTISKGRQSESREHLTKDEAVEICRSRHRQRKGGRLPPLCAELIGCVAEPPPSIEQQSKYDLPL